MLKTALVSVAIGVLTCSAAVAKKVKPEPEPVGCTAFSGKKCIAAPEIDPSSAIAGLTLLAGGVAVMVGRRSRRLEVQAD